MLSALGCVDLIVLFDEDTPLSLIEVLKPDVLAKGADYRLDEVVGADFVKRYGGDVVLIELLEGYSTTRIAQRVISANETN